MNYWLMKSEPDVFGIDDLRRKQVEHWDGVRNYQVRNMMRDQMQPGDLAFFYHSNSKPPGIAGILEIATRGYPDHTAFDPESKYYDPKGSPEDPRWYMVDVKYVRHLRRYISLDELKNQPPLEEMPLLQRGSRLSIMPVSQAQWEYILSLE